MICLQRVSTNCKQIFDAFRDTFARKAFGGGGGGGAGGGGNRFLCILGAILGPPLSI